MGAEPGLRHGAQDSRVASGNGPPGGIAASVLRVSVCRPEPARGLVVAISNVHADRQETLPTR
jgi:hypothetical protein